MCHDCWHETLNADFADSAARVAQHEILTTRMVPAAYAQRFSTASEALQWHTCGSASASVALCTVRLSVDTCKCAFDLAPVYAHAGQRFTEGRLAEMASTASYV
jgi:hypothetical protein